MNRMFLKASVAATISLALLYYSVAWAVLRCPHQEVYEGHGIGVHELVPSDRQVNFDCAGPEYHTEILAGPAASSEVLRSARELASHANVFSDSTGFALNPIHDVWLLALSHRASSAPSLSDPPRYLLLSVFRL